MARVWLICALVTGVVVVLIVLLTNKPDAVADGQRPPEPPQALTEQEVRTYITVWPEMQQKLGEFAVGYQGERARLIGAGADAATMAEFEKTMAIRSQALVDSLLEQRHLTRESWDGLRRRVEYVVDVMRLGPELEQARPEIEEKLAMKRALLPKLAREDERAMVEEEIRHLENLLEGQGPPLRDEDRDLARQYWRALNEAVPRKGPAPKPPR